MKKISHISDVPLFQGLPKQQIAALEGIVIPRKYAKGKVVFSDGEDATGFHVVMSGIVKVYKLSPDGKEQILHIFGPGEPFGEAAVFEGRSFPAYAEALEALATWFFPRQAFVALVVKDPSLALNMLADLSRRLRRFTNLIEDLSLKEVPGRLAAHLLYLSEQQADSDAPILDITKGQLASLLGTIPETLSRILARMTRDGLIEAGEGREVRLLDRESLEELARGERRLG